VSPPIRKKSFHGSCCWPLVSVETVSGGFAPSKASGIPGVFFYRQAEDVGQVFEQLPLRRRQRFGLFFLGTHTQIIDGDGERF
jgi:hypothetical protein